MKEEKEVKEVKVRPLDTYKTEMVSMENIFSDPNFNCRGNIAPIDVAELAKDIDENGLQVPITLQKYVHHEKPEILYRIIAGHRRHMAHKILMRKKIPAFFRNDLSEIDALALNLTENTNRNPLSFYEEAMALDKFRGLGLSVDKISKRISKSRGWIARRLQVFALDEVIQLEVKKGLLKQAHVGDIYEMRDQPLEAQYEYVKKIKDGKSVASGKKASSARPSPTPDKKRNRNASEIGKLMNLVYRHFGAGLATRCLAWASGNISDKECLDTMRKLCEDQGVKFYEPENGVIQ